jgi:deazaflavin-dependent oxidoreductase (nitroreductase family)
MRVGRGRIASAGVDVMKLADRSWPVLNRMMAAHAAVYRATGGRVGGRVPGLPPMLLLEHVGAKSGKRRSAPLVYMPDGDDFVVVAAKGGHPADPAWAHNLRAHPDAVVELGAEQFEVRAEEAKGELRRQLWPRAKDYNRFWRQYERRTDRTIPLFVLRRRA